MTDFERRLRALERRREADLFERMLRVAATELDVDPEVLRSDVQQLATAARGYPNAEVHIIAVAESLHTTVGDLEQEARRLEAAALEVAGLTEWGSG